MHRPAWHRGIAALLCTILIGGTSVFAAPPAAILHGTVTVSGGTEPIAGAVVLVGNPKDGSVVPSSPADAAGRFVLDGLPPATYRMAVRQGDRLWVVDAPITLAPGQTRDVMVGIDAQQAPSPAEAQEDSKNEKMGIWNNPLTATLIVVGAAVLLGVVIDAATDDDPKEPVSQSQ